MQYQPKWQFTRATLISLTAACVLSVAWLSSLIFISPSDRRLYEQVKQQGKAVATASSPTAAKQHRLGVRKDLWLSQEDKSRLHYRIDSQSSTLSLMPNDDKIDIVEHLNHLQCWMQDKLYTQGEKTMQQLRFFEADEGTYQYSTQRFSTNSATLFLFRTPGHTLPPSLDLQSAFLRGRASDITFALAGKMSQFQAKQFTATLISKQEESP